MFGSPTPLDSDFDSESVELEELEDDRVKARFIRARKGMMDVSDATAVDPKP